MDKKWAAEPWRAVPERVFIKGEDGWGSIVDAQDWFIAKLEDSLDPEANAQHGRTTGGLIGPDGPVLAMVVPTDEELMIARDTARLIGGT